MARFAQYAMAATEEAIQETGWKPNTSEQRESTVCRLPLRPFQSPVPRVLTFSLRVYAWGLASVTLTKSATLLWHTIKGSGHGNRF